MRLVERFWTTVVYLVTFGSVSPHNDQQTPLVASSGGRHPENAKGPIFKPPGGRLEGPGSDFLCDYRNMVGWSPCSTPDNRECWLKNDHTRQEYNIHTDYEDSNQTPLGVHRAYYMNITDGWINADGLNFMEGKFFNGTYPGPWIQACWGDNQLKKNGTSVHWHGIRQWLTMHMDGVNGVTQCPIAPGDTFNYTWRAMQYGSSWYHSHYSVQYADGAAGPITLHGPSSASYDEPKMPLLLTDWGHNSAFEAIWTNNLTDPSILLNGRGNVTRYNNKVHNETAIPTPYTITFDPSTKGRAKRYLLRIINVSFESTFVLSIDNHLLQIVGADFVPIHPYFNTSVLVGIGQRYHVIVTADPFANPGNPIPKDGNYWIRTWRANCFFFPQGDDGYERAGILRYDNTSNALPSTLPWSSNPYGNISTRCSDETYSSLKPIVPWTIGPAANAPPDQVGESFAVQLQRSPNIFPLALFSVGADDFIPLQIDYSSPTFLKLGYKGKWDDRAVVIPENYTDTDWVYMVIKGRKLYSNSTGAHPIHLHGHDFAILQQIENATYPDRLDLKRDNPPRRDVVFLPDSGYVVIAFKTDNPGTWLLHCHIATHASFGLGLQILERQKAATDIWPSLDQSEALRTAQAGCDRWNQWWGDCKNWWNATGTDSSCGLGNDGFSPDSGI
ncbi:multicopper oxidase-domain-containing protein [Exophiala viscosa]|uniref:Multicopper oxidase-domain-containing protein n=1 Tax=Exophiala viscosa TaxID=2486360 RepID=A0AAN6DVK8_9EURO|nr:multicopper oxidase-domain-containing protein [Exophiala viscosa]